MFYLGFRLFVHCQDRLRIRVFTTDSISFNDEKDFNYVADTTHELQTVRADCQLVRTKSVFAQ